MASRDTADKTEQVATSLPVTLRFDLVELETFLVVVELGSFSAAARRLHISQPSVTSRVQRLESMLKTKLLIRTTRHVAPTPAGRRLQERAVLALRDLRTLLQEFQTDAEEARFRVTIASTPMVSAVMLPTLIHAFGIRFPDVHIQLRDLQYDDVVATVGAGDVDFAVIAFDHDSDKLDFEPLSEEDILLIVPQSHSLVGTGEVSLAQLADLPLMILTRYATVRQRITEELARRNIVFKPAQEVVNLHTLLGMVDAGLGATVLPRAMAHRHAKDDRAILSISDFKLTRTFGILRSREATLSPAAECFLGFLQDNFRASVTDDH